MSVETFEATIKERLAGKRGNAVQLPGAKGWVYVREPAKDKAMQLMAQGDATHDVWVPLFAQFVKECFVGACDPEGNELTFEQCETIAGCLFMSSGAVGKAVNKLGGLRDAQTRDL